MKKNKLKMSNLVYRLIVIPLVILSLILSVALQTLSGQMPDLLDDYLGRGALKLKQNSENQKPSRRIFDGTEWPSISIFRMMTYTKWLIRTKGYTRSAMEM